MFSIVLVIRNIRIEEYYTFLIFSKVLSSNKDLSDIKFILINVNIYINLYQLQVIVFYFSSHLTTFHFKQIYHWSKIDSILLFTILNTYHRPKKIPSYYLPFETHISLVKKRFHLTIFHFKRISLAEKKSIMSTRCVCM